MKKESYLPHQSRQGESSYSASPVANHLPKFSLGQLVATPAALDLLHRTGIKPATLLARHRIGDWGDCCAEDRALNDEALRYGSRLFSVYRVVGADSSTDPTSGQGEHPATVWIITEAGDDEGRRPSTCILLPEDY